MVHTRPVLPAGHGELLAEPSVEQWPTLVDRAIAASAAWRFTVGGVPVADFRRQARVEAIEVAKAFSARMGVALHEPGGLGARVVMSGHQPDLYHPGVWVKDFLLDRLARETGATAIDLVVDSDGFETVALAAPCMSPVVRRCEQYLAVGTRTGCYACAPVPSADELASFRRGGDEILSTLKAPSVRRHFDEFCGDLEDVAPHARNLAELVTFSRRRYEAAAGTGYLELPVSLLAGTASYARFLAHVALDAWRFAAEYNAELAAYRSVARVRSQAQPVPDLAVREDEVELPFWLLRSEGRSTVVARRTAEGVAVVADGAILLQLPHEAEDAVAVVRESGHLFAPKALALTLYARVFLSDLFIHGVGGARYDRVTDGVTRRFFGVEAPPFSVASLTVYLPLGGHLVSEDEVLAATERVNRFEHNPDELLSELDFDDAGERETALALAREKRELVALMDRPETDKKATGRLIREANAALRDLLAPIGEELRAERDRLASEREAAEILTDRTYAFCLWSPEEIADKVR